MSEPPDIEPASGPKAATGRSGRSVIAVIGIDRYRSDAWRPLTNAVSDARGAAALFGKLGFEQVAALLDDQATSEAVEGLVKDDLKQLGPEDSLVLFYAGHGGTRSHPLGSQVVETGYLIPFDASDRTASWIDLESWLRAVSLLPAKHILVILDACHSGIALGSITKYRGDGAPQGTRLSALRALRSRRIITSALDHELALDSGPRHGHSLFTGWLLEALTHGVGHPGSRVITGSELGLYLQARVEQDPRSRQTPDFGTFELDERGELVIPFLMAPELAPNEDDGPGDANANDNDNAKDTGIVDPPGRRWRRLILAGAAGAALALLLVLLASNISNKQWIASHPAETPPAGSADTPSLVAQGGCPAGMVRVPAGTFRMGSPDGEGWVNERPQRDVTLAGYCIDRTEVTVREYRACMAAEVCSSTPARVRLSREGSPGAGTILGCNGADRPEHPINCVSWEQAAAYCKWAQKRLPSEAEWEYAARGEDGRRYPWGNQPPSASRLNACGSECALMAERQLGLAWTGMYNDDDGWPMTAPVGSYPEGASPFGALDLAGNVWELTTDLPRGGSWRISDAFGVRAAFRREPVPEQGEIDLGFRCARGD